MPNEMGEPKNAVNNIKVNGYTFMLFLPFYKGEQLW